MRRDPLQDGPAVFRLGPEDHAAVTTLLSGDQGHGLFIASALLSYGYAAAAVRFWGIFAEPEARTLTAILLISTSGASVYAQPAIALTSFGRLLAREHPPYLMGQADGVARLSAVIPAMILRTETHHFAELPKHRFAGRPPIPPGSTVRRATLADVAGLVKLYTGSTGFEALPPERIEPIMRQRVAHFRTTIATVGDMLVAAASTSAEIGDAAMIGGVWTAPAFRGEGYASAVVGALCADLWRERRRPYLFYLDGNDTAAALYVRLGFRVTDLWRIIHLV